MEKRILTRDEVRVEDTWKLEDLYLSEELFLEDKGKLERMIPEFSALQGTLGENAEQFVKVLCLYEEMNAVFEKLYVYANQSSHQDTANAHFQEMTGQMQIMMAQFSMATAWLEPELLELDEQKVKEFLKLMEQEMVSDGRISGKQQESFARFVSQILRKKAHILDAEKEALLARVSELGMAPSNIFAMFNNADIAFPEVEDGEGKKHPLTQGTYISCLESQDRVLRKNAFEALYQVYGQYRNTLAATYYANAKQADFFAKERNYENTMEEALDASAIPTSVYKNLIEAIHERFPAMHRYVRLRKKLLGLPELHMYDVYVPMVKKAEVSYSFEEAKQMVKTALAPMGKDYLEILQEGFDQRWIDVYENKGKRTGAYSWGAYGTHPYVLLNYHGNLNDVFTLVHEMGHAIHTWHSNKNQAILNAGYRIFVAEVASTCNEALLIHDLLKRTDDLATRKYLINYFLDQFKGTMYRQTMFAEFEMLTHQKVADGESLTAEGLCEVYLGLNQKYFGEDMISDEQISYEWARIPHFYTPFYVYQYATGFAAAIAISSKILAGEEGIVEKYKEFLSGGCAMDPIDLLKICGVDMSTPDPVNAALDVFEEFLKELEGYSV